MSSEQLQNLTLPTQDCRFCGKTFASTSHSDLNEQLVRHGMEDHELEVEMLKQRTDTFDPIAVADLIRSDPNE